MAREAVRKARQKSIAIFAALESFIDVDGEPVIERMIGLAQLAVEVRQPILFQ